MDNGDSAVKEVAAEFSGMGSALQQNAIHRTKKNKDRTELNKGLLFKQAHILVRK